MDSQLRELCREARKLTSEAAYDWLIAKFPLDTDQTWKAIFIIPHRSWERREQVKLF